LPSGERNKASAWQTLLYTISLIPIGVMPYATGLSGWISMTVILAVSIYFALQSWKLYRECSIEAARKLMFGSFIYLPVVQIALVLDKTVI
jgi:heme o synthase